MFVISEDNRRFGVYPRRRNPLNYFFIRKYAKNTVTELISAKMFYPIDHATDRSILMAMTIWKVILSEGTSHSISAESIEVSADGSTVRFSIRAPGLGSIVTVASVTTTPGMIIVNSDHKQS